jgi:threonine dehydrogenase-like Zn-dependent dehydrogenase
MRSVKLDGNGAVRTIDAETPRPGPGEVLIRTAVSALCGSELSTYRGEGATHGNSGHEGAGTVEQLGPGVTGLQPGQRVGVSAIGGCGVCSYCEQGQSTWCGGRSFHGSMHAEEFVAAATACHVLPEDVPWDVGVLISGDGFGVPYHTSTKIPGAAIHTVAIFGAGPIGLGNVIMQSHLGRRVIAIETSSPRLQLAESLGASHVIDAAGGADVVATVKELTNGTGADACIEAAGQTQTAKQCFQAVRTAGTVVFNGEQPAVELSPSEDFIRRDIWAVGAWFYHFSEFAEMLQLYRSGIPIDQLITHRLPLSQAAEGYHLMASRQSGKVVLGC